MKLTLRAARINAKLNQEEAAKNLNISLSTLQNYENGRSYPDVPIIKRIENLYGVEYRDLIFI